MSLFLSPLIKLEVNVSTFKLISSWTDLSWKSSAHVVAGSTEITNISAGYLRENKNTFNAYSH